jgi:hypothetical protein
MEKILEEVDFLVGEKSIHFEELMSLHSFEVFSNDTVNFLSELSNNLLKHPESRKFPDVATFAFYCRSANLCSLKKMHLNDHSLRLGRGIVFHITPGNVPVNFAYSLLAGLLMGNINIVKVPSKQFEQINIIVSAIKEVLREEKYENIFSKRLYIVRYERESKATALFSSICDVRIIWGGDHTINDIRKSSISPKSTEITFSDRYSIAVIKASSYLASGDKGKIAQGFYNDTYLFDQNACTSPQAICWLGSETEVEKAKMIFWDMMQSILEEKKFDLQPILSVDKLTTFYSQAISYGDIKKEPHATNEIWRVNNVTIHSDIDLHKCSSGYFNEISISSLDELKTIISRKYQTIGYVGISESEFNDWFITSRPLGIDRIVPIGRTMDFSLFWDGHNLVSSLSRQIQII